MFLSLFNFVVNTYNQLIYFLFEKEKDKLEHRVIHNNHYLIHLHNENRTIYSFALDNMKGLDEVFQISVLELLSNPPFILNADRVRVLETSNELPLSVLFFDKLENMSDIERDDLVVKVLDHKLEERFYSIMETIKKY